MPVISRSRPVRGSQPGPGRRKSLGRVVVPSLAVLSLALGAFLAFPSLRAVFGLAERPVQIIYVREENSLGLLSLPSPEISSGSHLDPSRERLVLPEGSGALPAGTQALILRETFCAGLCVEARVIFVRRFPTTVEARPPLGDSDSEPGLSLPGSVAPGAALLAVNLVLDRSGNEAVRLEAPGLLAGPDPKPIQAAVIGPGDEWRLGAALGEDGRVVTLLPGEESYEGFLTAAFRNGRPVSVISVGNLGYWPREAIENPGG